MSILVVEDSFLIRYALVDYLTEDGFDVSEASHAEAALLLLASGVSFDIMFTDIEMPGDMNGLALAKEVRLRWPSTRVLVTSGQIMPGADDLHGVEAFVGKPYGYEAVASKFRSVPVL